MKLKRLISALVVFTLVLTSAMSAVSAASFSTTTTYSTSGDATVKTEVLSGLTDGTMVSYIIYDDSTVTTPAEGNIKYIDQGTVSSGKVDFEVTDTIAKLEGKRILMGASAGDLSPNTADVDDVVAVDSSDLLVSVDDVIVNTANNTVTILVSQNNSTATGVNVYAYDSSTGESVVVYEFLGLENLSDDTDYAIQLIAGDGVDFDFTKYSYVATPYVVDTETEMTGVNGTSYYVVAE